MQHIIWYHYNGRIGYRSDGEAQFSGYGNEHVSNYDSDGDKNDVVAVMNNIISVCLQIFQYQIISYGDSSYLLI